jgi:hypothetical protein
MFKITHTATKSETYLKVKLDYKINGQQRRLLRGVTKEIVGGGGNAYDVTIAFMIGQLNALSLDEGDPKSNKRVTDFVAEKYPTLFEMNFEASGDWMQDLNELRHKYAGAEEKRLKAEREESERMAEEKRLKAGRQPTANKRIIPDEYLVTAYQELQNDNKDVATWARAFSQAGGEGNRAEALYISLRSERLYAEEKRLKAERAEADRIAEEKRLKAEADRLAEKKRIAAEKWEDERDSEVTWMKMQAEREAQKRNPGIGSYLLVAMSVLIILGLALS